MKNKQFSVWAEGYRATGESSEANFLGTGRGVDFKSACVELMGRIDSGDKYYNKESNTYWGCSLFDDECDARSSFG